jgi:hypothetical protein
MPCSVPEKSFSLFIRSLTCLRQVVLSDGSLDLIAQNLEVFGELREQLSFGFVGGEVADQLAFGRLLPELLQMLLHVFHGRVPPGQGGNLTSPLTQVSNVQLNVSASNNFSRLLRCTRERDHGPMLGPDGSRIPLPHLLRVGVARRLTATRR